MEELTMSVIRRGIAAAAVLLPLALLLASCGGDGDTPDTVGAVPSAVKAALVGEYLDRTTFRNPYGHIPAQCYVETSGGTQNACLFCHTNGVYLQGLGNNNPQAGYEPLVGDLQQEYAFVALRHPFVQNGSVMPWENTLHPERLQAAVAALGVDPADWDMESYVRQDNWRDAYAQRPGSPLEWDPKINVPFRLFPGLDPADLPADADGFVRSEQTANGFFNDAQGRITGWRAVNFMPYGIFTPHTGSVSGIYLRLPEAFMRNSAGDFDLATYRDNLDLLERAIQDRLLPGDPAQYHGVAATIAVQRGLYPLGTEFAHPLHYVDVAADGSDAAVSPFPGTRARRVKEMRYMYKYKAFNPWAIAPGNKEEGAPLHASATQGWADNGAGWYLAGYIENAAGTLRPQTPAELVQCVGCHSGNVLQPETGYAQFNSGTGNTIDSTWAFPRKFAGDAGWREMDYLGYVADAGAAADATPGRAGLGDPINRKYGVGEFRFFLEHVVGASLYGDMPAPVEAFLAQRITTARGYSANWPALDTAAPATLAAAQRQRQILMRELTARKEHLDADGSLHGALLYPPRDGARAGAARYRQVVATQRYDLGKDVFDATPFTYRYYRDAGQAFAHQDGNTYQSGEVISDRPIDTEPTSFTYGIGVGATLIDAGLPFAGGGTYEPEYSPLLLTPPAFE
jgi:hypothetical protein